MARVADTAPRLTHPLYATWKPVWEKAFDVYEGAGGLIDPKQPYLIAHPREFLDHTLAPDAEGKRAPNPTPSPPGKPASRSRPTCRDCPTG